MPDASALKRHVRELAEKHGITVRYTKSGSERAVQKTRTIYVAPIKGRNSYLAALHEIAHLVGRGCWYGKDVMEAEQRAWLWALKKSIIPFDYGAYRMIYESLFAYRFA